MDSLTSPTSFEMVLTYGGCVGPILLDWYKLDSHHVNPDELAPVGLLKKKPVGEVIRCRGCHDFIRMIPLEDDDGINLYGDCQECGLYELFEEEKFQWQVDYSPIFEEARKMLSCGGSITEIVPDMLWNLGRAPICGQSREIYACSGINTRYNSKIISNLPQGKTPLLLVLGGNPKPENLGHFSPDRVFNFSHMTKLENGRIIFDPTHIQNNAGCAASADVPPKKASGRNSMIGDVIIKLKAELRQFMQGVYSDFEQAEKFGREPVFDGIKQNQLAVLAGVTPVIVNRALKKDMELKALFDTANNPRTAYAYGSKAQR